MDDREETHLQQTRAWGGPPHLPSSCLGVSLGAGGPALALLLATCASKPLDSHCLWPKHRNLDSVLLTIGYALTALHSLTVLYPPACSDTFLLGRLCCLFSVPFAKGSSAGPLFDLHHDWMVVSPASFVHACIHSSNISGYLLCGVCFIRVPVRYPHSIMMCT